MKRGSSRYPPSQFRIKQEDILLNDSANKSPTNQGDEPQWILDDYNQSKQLREQQYRETKDFDEFNDEEYDRNIEDVIIAYD